MSRPFNPRTLSHPPQNGVVIRISRTAAKVLSATLKARKRNVFAKSLGDLASEAIIAAYDTEAAP